MGNYIIFWRCCLSDRILILHTGIQFSATTENKDGEMQKVILEECVQTRLTLRY